MTEEDEVQITTAELMLLHAVYANSSPYRGCTYTTIETHLNKPHKEVHKILTTLWRRGYVKKSDNTFKRLRDDHVYYMLTDEGIKIVET